ncbi:MAG TPA: hypothetical protein PLW86_02400 [Rhodocyclaceae bacterium]|nr:hypothetical protein [Rhodocyclaceae bacterium]
MKKLNASQIKIDQALAWDVYDAQGHLLLRKGFVVQSESQLESLLERGMYVSNADWEAIEKARKDPEPENVFNPFWLWDDILSKVTYVLKYAATVDLFEEKITGISFLLQTLVDNDADAALGSILLKDSSRYAYCHSVHVAVLSAVVSKRMGWSDQRRRELIQAALSMNVAMIELQTMLLHQQDPLTEQQRIEVNQHPQKGYEFLREKGVTNTAWLEAVRLHHEKVPLKADAMSNPDGAAMAQLIRVLDVFGAKVSPRTYRRAMQPPVAAKEIFVQEREVCAEFVDVLIKEIGLYMPGTFVKLENGETALVIKRGANVNTPKVVSLSRGDGMPYIDGPKRDTSKPEFAVKNVVPKEKIMHMLNLSKLWGY